MYMYDTKLDQKTKTAAVTGQKTTYMYNDSNAYSAPVLWVIHVSITSHALLHTYYTCTFDQILRKKGKATQHNRKTKQYNTTRPRQVFFKDKKLPRVGFEPTTVSLLGDALTN